MGAANSPGLSFDNLHTTASEHCGWMSGLILDHVLSIQPSGGELEATFGLIRRLSVEAADCIIFPVAPDDAQRLALCEAIADSAVKEARGRATKAGRE